MGGLRLQRGRGSLRKLAVLGGVLLAVAALAAVLLFVRGGGGASDPAGAAGAEMPAGIAASRVVTAEQVVRDDWFRSANLDCRSCHEEDVAAESEFFCPVGAAKLQDCMDCHSEGRALTQVHAGTFEETRVRRAYAATLDAAPCLTCHNADALVQATASVNIGDAAGSPVNPHALLEDDGHDPTCFSCHRVHASRSASVAAASYCAGCHHHRLAACSDCHDVGTLRKLVAQRY